MTIDTYANHPCIPKIQKYKYVCIYGYLHPSIPPASKLSGRRLEKKIVQVAIDNQPYIPHGDNKDNCHIIIKRCPYKIGGSCQPQNITHVHMSIQKAN